MSARRLLSVLHIAAPLASLAFALAALVLVLPKL